jgi:hypothetical protein
MHESTSNRDGPNESAKRDIINFISNRFVDQYESKDNLPS